MSQAREKACELSLTSSAAEHTLESAKQQACLEDAHSRSAYRCGRDWTVSSTQLSLLKHSADMAGKFITVLSSCVTSCHYLITGACCQYIGLHQHMQAFHSQLTAQMFAYVLTSQCSAVMQNAMQYVSQDATKRGESHLQSQAISRKVQSV